MRITLSKLQSQERKEQRELDEFWATAIKNRDNWECVICGSKYAPNAHHIIPRENKSYRYEEDNGISLCVKHHKFSRIISAHNNPLAFFLWLMLYRPDQYFKAVKRTRQLTKGECDL